MDSAESLVRFVDVGWFVWWYRKSLKKERKIKAELHVFIMYKMAVYSYWCLPHHNWVANNRQYSISCALWMLVFAHVSTLRSEFAPFLFRPTLEALFFCWRSCMRIFGWSVFGEMMLEMKIKCKMSKEKTTIKKIPACTECAMYSWLFTYTLA